MSRNLIVVACFMSLVGSGNAIADFVLETPQDEQTSSQSELVDGESDDSSSARLLKDSASGDVMNLDVAPASTGYGHSLFVVCASVVVAIALVFVPVLRQEDSKTP